MPKRRQPHTLRRGAPNLEPKRRILIVCEGSRTEPSYFESWRRHLRNPLVELVINDEAGVPRTLVRRAAEKKREAKRLARRERDAFMQFEEVWCVFDVDDHPNLADARDQARANQIDLAISNPCFELWGLLHFQDQWAFLDRSSVVTYLKTHLPTYRKLLPFDILLPRYEAALARARNLDQRCASAGSIGDNPSTGAYRLTESLLNSSKPVNAAGRPASAAVRHERAQGGSPRRVG
jgi:RloB-like protein